MSEEESMDTESNTKYKDGVNKNARLIVKNVSFKATEESLKEHFSQFGKVEEIKLLKKPDGKLVGSAFVHYTHVPMAQKALFGTNKKPFLGRPIFVSWAVPKYKYNEEENKKGQKQRYFNHDESNEESKPGIKSEDDTKVKKEPKDDKNRIRLNRKARLIIRNISFKATEDTLKQHFEPYGTVLEVTLLKKPDGKMVGCGFVLFKNVQMAKEALANTNMKPFLGRPISVDWAVPKNQYMRHVVDQQIEMEEKIKREESDSDDDTTMNISIDDVKDEIKSESEKSDEGSDSEDEKIKPENEDDEDEESGDEDESDDKDDEDDEDEESSDDDENDDDQKSVTSTQPDFQRTKLNDAEDGCTVFIRNIPFSVDNAQLQAFAERTGPVKYALICVDKLTEHSKGSGFVKFVNIDDAVNFLALPPDQLRLEGQVLQIKPALKRENLQKRDKKQPKDNRNLYLVKEGVIIAGTKAAVGVSSSDMSKRLTLERSKTQMLKNLNRFVSRYRIVVSNLPHNMDDNALRRVCARSVGSRAVITEARVMRDLRAPLGRDGKHPSKGYGFVMFTLHEDALACLRKLNNNPDIFDKNNRPIVSFSIEDRTALNARKKRLEKSIANNPLAKQEIEQENRRKNRKRKHNSAPDESYMKKGRFDKNKEDNKNERQEFNNKNNAQNEFRNNNKNNKFNKNKNQNQNGLNNVGQFVKKPMDDVEYAGLTAKEGSQHKMRSNHKLKAQADIHRQHVKQEKKTSKRAQRLKMAARERIKQPKQKINKNKTGKRNKKRRFNSELM